MVVAGLLFAGALVALTFRWEAGFWVLFGLTIVWQLVRLDGRATGERRHPERD